MDFRRCDGPCGSYILGVVLFFVTLFIQKHNTHTRETRCESEIRRYRLDNIYLLLREKIYYSLFFFSQIDRSILLDIIATISCQNMIKFILISSITIDILE